MMPCATFMDGIGVENRTTDPALPAGPRGFLDNCPGSDYILASAWERHPP